MRHKPMVASAVHERRHAALNANGTSHDETDSERPITWPATFDNRTDGCNSCSSTPSDGLMTIAAPRSSSNAGRHVYIYISDRASQASRTDKRGGARWYGDILTRKAADHVGDHMARITHRACIRSHIARYMSGWGDKQEQRHHRYPQRPPAASTDLPRVHRGI